MPELDEFLKADMYSVMLFWSGMSCIGILILMIVYELIRSIMKH
ncbi:hypothetical protein [Salipaludibacillus sp. LMS25]|nr:hypothetical protein [Salipaludibacillus sp. LMS25]